MEYLMFLLGNPDPKVQKYVRKQNIVFWSLLHGSAAKKLTWNLNDRCFYWSLDLEDSKSKKIEDKEVPGIHKLIFGGTWRIIPFSWLVTPIYKPWSSAICKWVPKPHFKSGRKLPIVIHHLQVMGWSSKWWILSTHNVIMVWIYPQHSSSPTHWLEDVFPTLHDLPRFWGLGAVPRPTWK